jgi:hypothetical protein
MMASIESWIYRAFSGDTVSYKNGTELRVCCPFCEEEGKGADNGYHLYISLVKEAAHCFRCDFGTHSYAHLISKVAGTSMADAFKQLSLEGEDITPLYILRRKAREHLGVDKEAARSMDSRFMTIKDAWEAGGLVRQYALAAEAYMQRRLFRMDLDVHWRHYCRSWGVWTNSDGYGKLVFPIEDGWWQYRHIFAGFDGPKYVSCTRPKEWRMYNAKALENYHEVYVAEGVFSAVAIGLRCVGLCGKKATPQQTERLCKAKVGRYVLCLDANTDKETTALATDLVRAGKKVVIRRYIRGDPADGYDYTEYAFAFESQIMARLGSI